MGVENVSGRLSLLRVHDRGDKYGPDNDRIDVEVVVQFAQWPGEAFGFQLRNDGEGPAREGMLGLLRDGFNHGWTVHIDYERATGRRNGVAFRVWLTRPAGRSGGGGGGIVLPASDVASAKTNPATRKPVKRGRQAGARTTSRKRLEAPKAKGNAARRKAVTPKTGNKALR